ncbi:MAG TPA: nickel pincer cofactor biosynthesis protein LarC [Armatimonadetes bacterium]|nr:nickel pincer cofactor biosynthesis protein LarC [Armatimonadota bacterium]
MTWAWFDCAAGASGDMALGAMVDAGLDFDALRDGLAGLNVSGYTLSHSSVMRRGVRATKVDVTLTDEAKPHRHLKHIEAILDESKLDEDVRERARAIFRRLAEAEAKVHGTTVERIHFHEVGAVDAIVDVVGTCLGLKLLGVDRVGCTPLPVSYGWVDCEHGRLPVPAWATQELLRDVPSRPLDVEGETLTPTGAAILTTLAETYEMPTMTTRAVGYGAGTKDFGIPNILRLVLGEAAPQSAAVTIIEANIDDMNPEWWDMALARITAAGAMDATLSPLQMKKNRPAVLLRVLCEPSKRDAVLEAVVTYTTTLGVRYYAAERHCLEREWHEVTTAWGLVPVKVARAGGQVINVAPEYEACRALAEETGVTLKEVYVAAEYLARTTLTNQGKATI